MKRLIQFAALSALALPVTAAAQKAPVYDCWVLEAPTAEGGYTVLGIARDNEFVFKNRYLVADLDDVKMQCRTEIVRMQSKDAKPIAAGKVDLSEPVNVPVPPTQEQLDLAAFQLRASRAAKLSAILPADDADLGVLKAQLAADLKAHPEWIDAI